ncbi:MAG: glyoxalase, partial [Fusobacteriales bacterium]|nr:glyoxalase [Fusobacteriales bacterium]
MKIVSFSPNLMVKNVNKSIEFYCNILDFSLVQTVPESGELNWGLVEKDGLFVMFQKEESIKQEYPELNSQNSGGALTFYIKISNIREFYNKICSYMNVSHE